MDFVQKTDWVDDPSHATPIEADELLRMEAGIAEGARDATESLPGNLQLASDAVMASGTSLTRVPSVKKIVDYIAAQLSSLPTASAATTTAAGVVELATATEMTTATDTARVPAVKTIADYVTAALATLSSSFADSLLTKADKSGSWTQFFDVADATYDEGDVPMALGGTLTPVDLSLNYAQLDANQRLESSAWPQFYVPSIIITEGDVPPGTFPAYGLVGKLPAAASLLPTLLAVSAGQSVNNIALTLPEAVAIGEYLGFTVAWSNELGFDHVSAIFGGTGAGAGTFDFGTLSIPNVTAGELNGFVKLTTAAASGSTITFTSRDSSNVANGRAHMIAAVYRLPNLVTLSPRDQQAVAGGNSSSTLTSIGAAITTDTAQPSEIVIGSAILASGTSPNLRDIAGTSDWSTLVNQLSDGGGGTRRLYVGYKVLTAVGKPALTTVVTLTGTATQTGTWAAKIDSFKGI